jgi:ferredoxin-NADP reductase
MTELGEEASGDTRWQNAAVVAIESRTPRIKSFFLAQRAPFHFRAGQHVDLRLTAENGYTAMRSYSIGSSPSNTRQIELSIERLADGEISPFFHDVVVVGDEVELRGPLGGHFTWSPTDGGRKAFEIPGPVLIGIPVDYRDNHLLFENVFEHLLN